MNRAHDWEPLAGSDPVPGDPYEVRRLSRELRDIADAIRQQTSEVRRLTDAEHWEGKASEKFAETARTVTKHLHDVQDRYDAAVTALDHYAPRLEAEQTVTERLRREAQDLEADRRDAQYRLNQDDRDEARSTASGVDHPKPARHFVDRDAVAAYGGRLRRMQHEMHDAQTRIRHAAEDAARHLAHIAEHDGLKDGLGDKVKHLAGKAWEAVAAAIKAIAPFLKVLAKICQVISAIAGVLALLTCWIPGVGAFFGAIALVTGAIALVCDLLLYAIGEASLGDVLLDALGVVTGGIGKAVGGVVKGISAASKMEKATELVIRGERLSADAAKALKAGKLSDAARLSGLAEGKLSQLVGGRLGNLTQQGYMQGGRAALGETIHRASMAGKVSEAGGPLRFAFKQFALDADVVEIPSLRAIGDILTHNLSGGQTARIIAGVTIASHDTVLAVSTIPDLVDHGFDLFDPNSDSGFGRDVYNPKDLFGGSDLKAFDWRLGR